MKKAEQFQTGLMVVQLRAIKKSMEEFNTLIDEQSQITDPIEKESLFVAIRLRISQLEQSQNTLTSIKNHIEQENMSYLQDLSVKIAFFAFKIFNMSNIQDLYLDQLSTLPILECDNLLNEMKFYNIQNQFSQ